MSFRDAKRRRLGAGGPEVSAIGLGCMGMSEFYGPGLMDDDESILPIPGTKRAGYLDENLGAADVRLTADELREIDRVLAPVSVSGDRYHAQAMQAVNR